MGDKIADRLTEIRDRHAKATPGPYHADQFDSYIWGPKGEMIADSHTPHYRAEILRIRGTGARLPQADNMAFFAHSWADIPFLLDHIAELDAERREGAMYVEALLRQLARTGPGTVKEAFIRDEADEWVMKVSPRATPTPSDTGSQG